LLKLLDDSGCSGVGMDCSIVPSKRYPEMSIISTTDFFFPLVEDPYLQGRIACANVLSDMYALGVVDIDNVLMLLAASIDMPQKSRDICTKLIMRGFNDQASAAGTAVTGGQSVHNPWPLIGGVAKSCVKAVDYIMPTGAVTGDVLVLTKPLGTQIAVNVQQWRRKNNEAWRDECTPLISVEDAQRMFGVAQQSMATLNRQGAVLMHKYGAHGATDVTGFGFLGHASNLASNQIAPVHFRLHTLPLIRHTAIINKQVNDWGLLEGYAAETSGGLLVALPSREIAEAFLADLKSSGQQPAEWGWIVGDVCDASAESLDARSASIIAEPTIVDV
jgi:selenide,water dikinase